MARLTIFLDENERIGLIRLAAREMRWPRDQIRFIVRNELERQGLLQTAPAVGDAYSMLQPERPASDLPAPAPTDGGVK